MAAVFAAMLLAFAAEAHGADPPPGSPAFAPLAFLDESITTTCAKLATGHPIVIVNRTIEVLPVRTRWGSFRNTSDQTLVERDSICGGLGGIPQRERGLRVLRGTTQKITLGLAPNAIVPTDGTKEFKGTMSVFTRAGIATTIPITIAEQESTTVPAEPVLESISVTNDTKLDWRSPGWRCSDAWRWPVSRVAEPADSVTMWIPIAEPPAGKSIDDTQNGKVVGALGGGDNESARLTVVRVENEGTEPRVGLHSGDLPPGTYEGTVDLNGDSEGGEVAIELRVKDPWYYAAGVISLSLLVAGLFQWLYAVFLPRRQLRHEIDQLDGDVGDAQAAFRSTAGDRWPNITFSAADEKKKLREKLDKTTRGAVLQIDQKVIDAVRTDIQAVAARIGALPRLAAQLVAVGDLLSKQPRGAMPDRMRQDPETEPLLARKAIELSAEPTPTPAEPMVSSVEMQVSSVETRQAQLDAALKDVQALIDAEIHIASLVDDWETLHRDFDPSSSRRSELPALEDALIAVWHQVWNAGTSAQLGGYVDEIAEVDGKIAALWPLLDDPRERRWSLLTRWLLREQIDLAAKEAAVGEAEAVGEPDEITYALEPRGTREQLVLDVTVPGPRRWFTLVLMCVAVAGLSALAVLVGMTALYVGEPFGSSWDYVKAITYGLVTPAAVAGLVAVVNRLGETAALRRVVRRI